jgi:hypothetical protein
MFSHPIEPREIAIKILIKIIEKDTAEHGL